jgi:hypothetical protein
MCTATIWPTLLGLKEYIELFLPTVTSLFAIVKLFVPYLPLTSILLQPVSYSMPIFSENSQTVLTSPISHYAIPATVTASRVS